MVASSLRSGFDDLLNEICGCVGRFSLAILFPVPFVYFLFPFIADKSCVIAEKINIASHPADGRHGVRLLVKWVFIAGIIWSVDTNFNIMWNTTMHLLALYYQAWCIQVRLYHFKDMQITNLLWMPWVSESNQLESQGRSYYSLIHAKTVVSGQLGVKIVTVCILHGVAACILRGVEFFPNIRNASTVWSRSCWAVFITSSMIPVHIPFIRTRPTWKKLVCRCLL